MTKEFPLNGLLPKRETESLQFIEKNPTFDGRGTLIAILDTGVDPGAPGMKLTSDKKVKVVECIDCTSSGDCHMVEKTVLTDLTDLIGETGRQLKIPQDWINLNKSKKWMVGLKDERDLFSGSLQNRLNKENEKTHSVEHANLLARVQTQLSDATDNATKKDLHKRMENLIQLQKDYKKDPSKLLDCIAFHDGEEWRAALDTSGSGDFSDSKLMANYSLEHEYAKYSVESMLNYSFNIYDNGRVVSIVTTAGSHGTHVAAISAAYHEPGSELNGVAPGAQIVSLKIGDHRLGSMETGRGLLRAATELARLKVDVANISYGEPICVSNSGRFYEVIKDVVNKTGTTVVASGGNGGPALTTVGAPGGIYDCILSVGAWVSHAQMKAEYSMLDQVPERPYTWSSRGPSPDGEAGVDIFAPGSAITSVPQYNLFPTQRMNGTSMSSPNCAGCVALIISGLKQKSVEYSPYKLKQSIKHSAKKLDDDEFSIGLIQVNDCFEHLLESREYRPTLNRYRISLDGKNRGVYLRNAAEMEAVQESRVVIRAEFPQNDNPSTNKSKLNFQVQCTLTVSDDWIQAPDFKNLTFEPQDFLIRVDPTGLKPGFHYGWINAVDSANPEVGPLFTIPVTVCKPIETGDQPCNIQLLNLNFTPGEIKRYFVNVPAHANFCKLIVRSVGPGREQPGHIRAHLLQLIPSTRYSRYENEFAFRMSSTGRGPRTPVDYVRNFGVVGGVVMECCLAQFWSSLDETVIDVELEFHSVLVSASKGVQSPLGVGNNSGGDLLVNSDADGFGRLDFYSPLAAEKISPKISFDICSQTVKSEDQNINTLLSRDLLPDGRQTYEMILHYTFKVPGDSQTSSTTLKFERFNDQIYDSVLDHFALMVFDSQKKRVEYQDCYHKGMSLTEGEYTVHVQLCSTSFEYLESLKYLNMTVEHKLSTGLVPTLTKSLQGLKLADKSNTVKSLMLQKNARDTLFVEGVKAPKFANPGDVLYGTLEVIESAVLSGSKMEGTLYRVYCPITSSVDFKVKEIEVGVKEPSKEDLVLQSEAVRDLEMSWIKKMKTTKTKLEYLELMEKKYPDHLPFHKERLLLLREMCATEEKEEFASSKINPEIKVPKSLSLWKQRLDFAKKTLTLLKPDQVAIYFGTTKDPLAGSNVNEKDQLLKKEMEIQRELLFLCRGAISDVYRILIVIKTLEEKFNFDPKTDLDSVVLEKAKEVFDFNILEYAKWNSSKDPLQNGEYLYLWGWNQHRLGNHGDCLEALQKYLGSLESGSKNISDGKIYVKCAALRLEVFKSLHWKLWVDKETELSLLKYPQNYCKF